MEKIITPNTAFINTDGTICTTIEETKWGCDYNTAMIIFSDLMWQSEQSVFMDFSNVESFRIDHYRENEFENEDESGYVAYLTVNIPRLRHIQIKMDVYQRGFDKWVHITTCN